jgi:hypothetical protein
LISTLWALPFCFIDTPSSYPLWALPSPHARARSLSLSHCSHDGLDADTHTNPNRKASTHLPPTPLSLLPRGEELSLPPQDRYPGPQEQPPSEGTWPPRPQHHAAEEAPFSHRAPPGPPRVVGSPGGNFEPIANQLLQLQPGGITEQFGRHGRQPLPPIANGLLPPITKGPLLPPIVKGTTTRPSSSGGGPSSSLTPPGALPWESRNGELEMVAQSTPRGRGRGEGVEEQRSEEPPNLAVPPTPHQHQQHPSSPSRRATTMAQEEGGQHHGVQIEEKLNGWEIKAKEKSAVRQFVEMLRKRHILSLRDPSGMFQERVMPILVCVLAMSILGIRPEIAG